MTVGQCYGRFNSGCNIRKTQLVVLHRLAQLHFESRLKQRKVKKKLEAEQFLKVQCVRVCMCVCAYAEER